MTTLPDRGRQGVRGGGATAPQPRRRQDDPHRRGGVVGAPRREPREDGDRRGPAHVHLPGPVRLPRRRRRGEPHHPRRGQRPVLRQMEGHPGRTPRDRARVVRAGADPARLGCSIARWSACRSCGRWPTRSTANSTRLSILFHDDPIRVRKHGDGYVLSMRLPFVSRDDMDIHRRGDELFVRVGSYKRNLILPQTLKRMVVREANFAGDHLEITFGRPPSADPDDGAGVLTLVAGQAIGVDVGGTKTASLPSGDAGRILARDVRPTPADDQEATLRPWSHPPRRSWTRRCVAIGIAAAGLVEAGHRACCASRPNLAWRDVPLLDRHWRTRSACQRARTTTTTRRHGASSAHGAGAGSATICCSWGWAPASAAASSIDGSLGARRPWVRRRDRSHRGGARRARAAAVATADAGNRWRAATRHRASGPPRRPAAPPLDVGTALRRRSLERDRPHGDRGGSRRRHRLVRHPRRGRAPVGSGHRRVW